MSAIYLAGLIQGVVLVAFPAASTLLTSKEAFGFSSAQYGALFIPQSILSIVASAISAKMCIRFGSKKTFSLGLLSNLMSMSLFLFSALIVKETHFVYPLLILATSFLGVGFGLTVPTINTMAALFRPEKVNTVILVLNALLGVGTVLAPLFTSVFIAFGCWWGLPLLLVISLSLLIIFSRSLIFPSDKVLDSTESAPFPKRAFIFMAFALLYGIVETLNGNWAAIYMREVQKASIQIQSLALTLFWAMVTLGRIVFASLSKYLSSRLVFQGLPVVIMIAFIIIGMLHSNCLDTSLFAIGLAGLGCSALLPLTISIGGKELSSISRSVAGIVVAFYLSGYGIAAFGTGIVLDWTTYTLSDVYAFCSLVAFSLVILAYFINKRFFFYSH